MQLVYTLEEMPDQITKSLFLAGGTGRSTEVESWRKDCLKILEDIGYDGLVIIPEMRDGKNEKYQDHYQEAIDWEEKFLNLADVILMWLPRDLSLTSDGELKLPCFTSNIEYGKFEESGKLVLGWPEDAEKNNYIENHAKKRNISVNHNLTETIHNALEKTGKGSLREKGERYIPLNVWNLPSFQQWYKAQTDVSNILESARVLYTFRPGNKDFIFLWILKADVYIAAEKRSKTNEFVLSRPDISSVLLWKKDESIEQSKIVLIKEFRVPATTTDGFIRELVSGSSKKDSLPEETAIEEVREETGLMLDKERLMAMGSRQLCGTLSAHKSHLFSYQLNDKELEWLKSQKDVIHGNKEDSEQTFIEIYTLKELSENNLVDWSNLGAIYSVIFGQMQES